jgi:outer membrane protein assembly factor BamB
MKRVLSSSRFAYWLLAAVFTIGMIALCPRPVHRALAEDVGPADKGKAETAAEVSAPQVAEKASAKPVEAKPPADAMTMFRGNLERSISGVGSVPRHPKLLWRFRTRTKLEGASERRGSKVLTPSSPWTGLGWTGQPCFLDGKLYYGSADSYVYAHDAKTGKLLWYYPNHHCIKGSITVANGFIYHGGRDNKIHCYTLSGKMVWETRTGNDMDSNPAVVNGRGYIGGEDNNIYCFNAKTGVIIWKYAPTDGSVESSPCVVNGRVYAGSGHGYLYCVDAANGKLVWKFKTLGDTDSSPVFYGGYMSGVWTRRRARRSGTRRCRAECGRRWRRIRSCGAYMSDATTASFTRSTWVTARSFGRRSWATASGARRWSPTAAS